MYFQVNSGDTVVIRGQPKGGPPDEITIILTGIKAPKLARRPNNAGEQSSPDEVSIFNVQLSLHF